MSKALYYEGSKKSLLTMSIYHLREKHNDNEYAIAFKGAPSPIDTEVYNIDGF